MVEPLATPRAVTGAVWAQAARATVAGTVATAVELEARFTVKPPGDGAWPPVRVKVSVPVLDGFTVRVAGVKVIVGAVTVTAPVPAA